LARGDDFFGIWDRNRPEEPLERFPPTEEGFDAADARFRELRRIEKRERGVWPRLLWTAVLAGSVTWIVAGVAAITWTMVSLTLPTQPGGPIIFQALTVLDQLGLRVAIGGILGLLAILLIRVEQRSREGGLSAQEKDRGEPSVPGQARPRLESFLRGALLAGVAVWIASAAATQTLSPYRGGPFQEPSQSFVIAQLVEVIAFRVWVVAFVLLIVSWAKAWSQRRTAHDNEAKQP
jgi:hypothetical protein